MESNNNIILLRHAQSDFNQGFLSYIEKAEKTLNWE